MFDLLTDDYSILIGCVGRLFRYEKHRFHIIGFFVQRINQYRVHASDGGNVE